MLKHLLGSNAKAVLFKVLSCLLKITYPTPQSWQGGAVLPNKLFLAFALLPISFLFLRNAFNDDAHFFNQVSVTAAVTYLVAIFFKCGQVNG